MLLGLRTAIYHVNDMDKAKQWYETVLGFPPYFDEPFYVGFNVGGYELGLHPTDSQATDKPDGVSVYWGVFNIEAEFARLLALGGRPHNKIQDVGEGIKVASVFDPFGNVFGLIENPHFKLDEKK